MSLFATGNTKIGGTAFRATTEGTYHLDLFNGTAPVGTLANGISLYSTSGYLYSMDSGGLIVRLNQAGEIIIPADSKTIKFGAGVDMSMGYDGTNGYVNTSLVAASDLDITCGANKTIELQNTVYEDLQFSITTGKLTPAGGQPNWEALTTNIDGYAFDVNDELDVQANELPHYWKETTTGHIHLHFANKTAQATGANRYAKFTIYFAAADVDEAWAESGPYTAEYTIPTGTAALTHLYLDMGNIDFSTFKIGAQVIAKVKRIAATGGTEYADSVYITQCGIHLENDTMGSRNETTK